MLTCLKINPVIMKHNRSQFKKVLLVFLLALIPLMFFGQEKKNTFAPYWYLKASIGPTSFHGDILASGNIGFGGDISFGRQLTPIFGFSGKIFYGSFNGENADWDRKFENTTMDYSFKLDVSLSNLIWGYQDRLLNWRTFVGYGQSRYEVTLFNTAGTILRTIGVGTSNRIAASIPFGMGVDYKINDQWSLTADAQMTWLDTDLFDAHNPAIAANQYNDYYAYLGFGAKYNFGASSGLGKMVKNYDLVSVKATPELLEERGNIVNVKISGTIPPKYFAKNAGMILQPYLVYEGGKTALKPILLKGENVVGDGTPIKYDMGGSFEQSEALTYTPDMNKSKLVILPVVYMANKGTLATLGDVVEGSKHQMVDKYKIADGVIYTSERIENDMCYSVAKSGYEKETIVTKKASLYFDKNRFNYNPNQKLNTTDHAKMHVDAVHEFLARGWKIKSIDINGYASPEGEETFNKGLSEKRANTMHAAAVKKMKTMMKEAGHDPAQVDMIKFNIFPHGADWKSLIKLIEKSDLADKASIINKIKRPVTERQKEAEIRKLMAIYPSIGDDMLPMLRRAVVAVSSYQPKKTDEEMAKLAVSSPDDLDLFELLHAASMAKCDQAMDIYKFIMKKYPKCWKSKNNLAVILLKHGEVDKAIKLLEDAHKMYPKVNHMVNNLGIAYVYKGDFKKAEKHFLKSKELGRECVHNFGVIEINKGNYAKAAKLTSDMECRYNAALAFFLNEDYSKAEKNLKCVKSNKAAAAYLLAVIGARTNNTSMLFKYLVEAIQADEAYKAQAKDDREFIKFENDAQFTAVVN